MELLSKTWGAVTYINNSVGNLLLATIALVALIMAVREYRLKNRPFLSCELRGFPLGEKLGVAFIAIIKNSGNCPASLDFTKIILNIGDEVFPTEISARQYVPVAGELQVHIGQINIEGINKYKGRQYKKNRIEAHLEANAASVYDNSIGSSMKAEFEIDFVNEGVTSKLVSFEVKNR